MLKKILQYKGVTQGTVIVVMVLSSCASSKSKHSEYNKSDSTSIVKEQTTKEVKGSETEVKKTDSEEENVTIFDFGDRGIVKIPNDSNYNDSGIYITPQKADDYFYWEGGTLLTNVIPKKVTIKGTKKQTTLDSAVKDILINENHSKITETQVKTVAKKSDKAKYSFNLLWLLWLLLIPAAVWLWRRYKDKIMAFYPF